MNFLQNFKLLIIVFSNYIQILAYNYAVYFRDFVCLFHIILFAKFIHYGILYLGVISIIVTVISIRLSISKKEHQKSNRSDQS